MDKDYARRAEMDGDLHSNRVSSNRSLCFQETEFCAQRQKATKHPEKFTETAAETKLTPQLGQLGASYQTAGKSLRTSECVVGPGGLEPPTKRL
jgi:hypothetical protein